MSNWIEINNRKYFRYAFPGFETGGLLLTESELKKAMKRFEDHQELMHRRVPVSYASGEKYEWL